MRKQSAFTLTELLVVIGVIVVLLVILMVGLRWVREVGHMRSICATNLHSIGHCMALYATGGVGNSGLYPVAEPEALGANCIGTKVDRAVGPGEDGSGNSRSLFLLVRERLVPPDGFICPSTGHKVHPDQDEEKDFDFRTGLQGGLRHSLSYSYQVQKKTPDFHNPTSKVSSPALLIVMADRNPMAGADPQWKEIWGGYRADVDASKWDGNSLNHDEDGQHVLRMDSSVDFVKTPFVGIDKDNIWCWEEPGSGADQRGKQPNRAFANAAPTSQNDSFLWP